MNKIYVIRKYIVAKSASEALTKEPKAKVDDVWVDDETHKHCLRNLLDESNKIGFMKKTTKKTKGGKKC